MKRSAPPEYVMNLPEFLQQDTQGEVHLTGHRIGLFHVVHCYNDGYSAEMLVCQYPTLSLALVHKVIAYYLENRANVDAYVVDCRARLQQQREANPRHLDVDTLRQRLAARQRAEIEGPSAKV